MDAVFEDAMVYVVLENRVHVQINLSPKTPPGRERLQEEMLPRNDSKWWTAAIQKLLSQTQDTTLLWAKKDVSASKRDDVSEDGIYSTRVLNRLLIVYEYGYKNYNTSPDDWDWETEVAIEFVDEDGCLQFQWPRLPERFQLLESIRYQTARVGDFLQQFLNDFSG